mmetsp:Transcript_25730/g.59762  ORF Transcript_25730/g.59762 Transcript_25730/m.59762 type:complete len:237 (+) Transcript_25730:773-1483(+)
MALRRQATSLASAEANAARTSAPTSVQRSTLNACLKEGGKNTHNSQQHAYTHIQSNFSMFLARTIDRFHIIWYGLAPWRVFESSPPTFYWIVWNGTVWDARHPPGHPVVVFPESPECRNPDKTWDIRTIDATMHQTPQRNETRVWRLETNGPNSHLAIVVIARMPMSSEIRFSQKLPQEVFLLHLPLLTTWKMMVVVCCCRGNDSFPCLFLPHWTFRLCLLANDVWIVLWMTMVET